jgi:hypothetical protein
LSSFDVAVVDDDEASAAAVVVVGDAVRGVVGNAMSSISQSPVKRRWSADRKMLASLIVRLRWAVCAFFCLKENTHTS